MTLQSTGLTCGCAERASNFDAKMIIRATIACISAITSTIASAAVVMKIIHADIVEKIIVEPLISAIRENLVISIIIILIVILTSIIISCWFYYIAEWHHYMSGGQRALMVSTLGTMILEIPISLSEHDLQWDNLFIVIMIAVIAGNIGSEVFHAVMIRRPQRRGKQTSPFPVTWARPRSHP